MNFINIEIKAHCTNPSRIRTILEEHGADYKGTDRQIDTYFEVPRGHLKLRKGNIEQNLIYYHRPDDKTPKASGINLVPAEHPQKLLDLLKKALTVKVVVDKEREIYFIDNVKFHIDRVKGLGNFMEIEAIDDDGTIGKQKLTQQCRQFMELLNIREEDLVAGSYSDLLKESG